MSLPLLFIIGVLIVTSYLAGRGIYQLKLSAVIGFMLFGVILGPSVTDFVSLSNQKSLGFITDITLGFVALTIGLELRISTLRKLGIGIVSVICAESVLAFVAVFLLVLLVTGGDLILALLFGAMAPASAPAGTVAVIQEYRAKGPLTNALYAIVGFDDGFAIIIFGFAAAIAKGLLVAQGGGEAISMLGLMVAPIKEIFLSLLVGGVLALLYCVGVQRLRDIKDQFIITCAFIFIAIGLSELWHLSLIMTNMAIGFVATNTQKHRLIERIGEPITMFMPLLYLLFFTLAGANLEIAALPALGLIGAVYLIGRSAGKIAGCHLGAMVGTLPEVVKKYAGISVLSQAGVAIGLALIVKAEFAGIGPLLEDGVTHLGDKIGGMVITSVTATSIIFGIVGPIGTKYGLMRAAETTEPT